MVKSNPTSNKLLFKSIWFSDISFILLKQVRNCVPPVSATLNNKKNDFKREPPCLHVST